MSEQLARDEGVEFDGQRVLRSNIYRYEKSAGINLVQWFNWLEDGAVLLVSEESEGFGNFHAWIAPPSGAAPFELLEIRDNSRYSVERRRIVDAQEKAVDMLCEMTNLPVPEDFKVAVRKWREKK
ncbi:hypothetical protein PTW37_16380 (plasmid) [Arthrobacter agilis]|uniref:hypothetical protein n=1 Tax=Arthrobacter agilis TaxID=37921 RepID=UPI002365A055|nr:hypothetical protein [Arthrobacter agilis]WDF35081.1 hypothetical protein PTW37_16380 [Arthrobacter agilis]